MKRNVNRRTLLKMAGIGTAGTVLAACQPKVVEKIVKETVVQTEVVKETVIVEGTPQVVEKVVVATAEPAPREAVTVRFAPWPGAPSREPQTAVVTAFNDSQDYAIVKEEEMGGEGNHYQKLKIRAAAGVLPDCAFMQGSHDYVSFIAAQLLLSIDDMIDADASFVEAERISPAAMPIFKVLGRTWGLPNEAAAFGMYYNKTLFDKAGVDYPEPGWNWSDFLEKAQALTGGEGSEKTYGFMQNFDPFRSEVWVRTNGSRYLSSDVFPQKISLTAPETVESVQFLQDLAWKYKVAPVEGQAATEAGGVGFDTGRVGMVMEGNWRVPGWSPKLEALGQEWDVAPLPFTTNETTWLSVDITPIFAATEYPQECYEFIKFWNKEGQPAMLDLWARMPVTPTDEGKALFAEYLANKGAAPLAADAYWMAWEKGWIMPLTPAWPEINSDVLAPAWEEMFLIEGTPVEETLAAAEARAQEILTEKGQPS